jgi:DNA-binding transcriptional MerR regulator
MRTGCPSKGQRRGASPPGLAYAGCDQLIAIGAGAAAAAQEASVDHDRGNRLDAPFGRSCRGGVVGADVVDDDLLMIAGQLPDEGLAGHTDWTAGTEDLDSLSHVSTVHIPPDWKVKRYRRSMRIGELADAVSVPAKTIRYYEEIGLLPPPERHPNGYRSYDESAGDRLRFVKAAQAVGFTLTEIRDIFSLRDAGEQPCGHVLDLVDRRARDITEQIEALERMRAELRRLSSRARATPAGDSTFCHLIEA